MTSVGDLGEFNLIDRLAAYPTPNEGVVVGIGDDTAVLSLSPGAQLLATCDGQVEGVHFLREGTPPRALGHRAMASNLSDIAAMGGRPRWALVALSLPADLDVAWVDELYEGMAALARRYGVGIVGGNVARSPGGAIVDVTLLGEVAPGRCLTRAGARPGDAIVVTGSPGDSAGGLELILHPELRDRLSEVDAARLLAAHRTPTPRVEVGQLLAASGAVTAMIDVSDGLAGDLGHVLAASHVGATLEEAALPLNPSLDALARAAGRDPLELVLAGGEAYELLFTCRRDAAERLVAELASTGLPAARIGTIEAAPGLRLLLRYGGTRGLAASGHDHFVRKEQAR